MEEVKFNKKVPNLPKSRVLKWGCIYQNEKRKQKQNINLYTYIGVFRTLGVGTEYRCYL